MNIQTSLLFITASVNCLLSLFVLFGKRDRVNIVYSLFVLFASFWAIGLAFFILESDLLRSLYIADFYYIAAAGIPVFFLYFSVVFLEKNISHNLHLLILLPFAMIISFFIFDKNFLIKEVLVKDWGKDVILNHFNYTIYSIYFLVIVFLSYFKLFNKLNLTKDGDERSQLKFIIFGTSIGFIFGMIFNLFLPFLGNYKYIFLGPVFSFSMVASIGYSITRHHLFNIKVIVTEVLIFLLWIFILVRTLLSVTFEDQIANFGLLIISIIVGIFLIRSVIKEVRLREELDRSNIKLKEANQGQTNLIHFMNHQVKGRFGTAKNIFAELLTDDYGVMPESSKFMLEKGLEETNMGIDYVQSILRGASAENGSLPLEMKTLDFKNIVEETFNGQREKAEHKGLKLKLALEEGEFKVSGDVLQLSESVRNLIDNSINYTIEGGIDVSLSSENNKVILKVKDTGVGLTDDDKPKLFKSGGRGSESLKFNVNSTGYGLAFVKGVIEAHKGRVWAESEGKDKGSTFYIELPKI